MINATFELFFFKQAKNEETEARDAMRDKLQQEIEDSAFKQTRLEKQVDDLKDKVQVRP